MTNTRTLRILMVEDEPGDARLMQLAMQQSGFPLDLHCVGDGLACLDCLHKRGD